MNSSPWAKLTTSMMPKIRVSPEATSARIMPVTTPLIVWISSWSKGMCMLDAQVLMDHSIVDLQRGSRRVMPDEAFFEYVDPLGRRQCQRHVLLDKKHRHIL